MKNFLKLSVLVFGGLVSVNSIASTFSFNGSLGYEMYPDEIYNISGSGQLEYDFSTGNGYGIETTTSIEVEPWPGYTTTNTYTSEIYSFDTSLNCLNGFGCRQLFMDNLSFTDVADGIIRWDADIIFEHNQRDMSLQWVYSGPAGGWVTLTSLDDGRFRMIPHASEGFGEPDYYGGWYQAWNLYGILTPQGYTPPPPITTPLPPAVLLFGTGLLALLGTGRLG